MVDVVYDGVARLTCDTDWPAYDDDDDDVLDHVKWPVQSITTRSHFDLWKLRTPDTVRAGYDANILRLALKQDGRPPCGVRVRFVIGDERNGRFVTKFDLDDTGFLAVDLIRDLKAGKIRHTKKRRA